MQWDTTTRLDLQYNLRKNHQCKSRILLVSLKRRFGYDSNESFINKSVLINRQK